MARDDFALQVKQLLAERVGARCSNPNCRQPTSGPQTNPHKALNVGVAAHITGAAKGGPRFDPSLTAEQRQSFKNGIWLCQTCAKLIDNDLVRYSPSLLHDWKRISEEAALLAIERPNSKGRNAVDDLEIIRFFAQCFDRPAFQDHFHQEGSTEAFDQAMEDTLVAINTGCLRSRDGRVLSQLWGKSFLSNPDWRQQMDVIADLLRAIRSRYADAKRTGSIHVNAHDDGTELYCINDRRVADWMDETRTQIIDLLAGVCKAAGITPLVFPRPYPKAW